MVIPNRTSNPTERRNMTLGPVGHRISEKLVQAFAPASLEVIDESHQHVGHSGSRPDGESHFRIKIAASQFRGKSRVEQHRMVNAVLAEELRERVHALAIQSSAPPVEASTGASEMAFVTLAQDDRRLVALLAEAGLPTGDLDTQGLYFVGILGPDDLLLACGGLEVRGDAALIRSIAVARDARKAGLGTAMTFKLLAEGRNRGAAAAYLLTASAAGFFGNLGFTAVARERVPAVIAQTSQFTGAACASAQAMVHVLRR
ncbi:MAG: BolA/IbaG family iron-sulfur metabolism protein [Alphaproteobacteria bacterium]|nr:BolA/IbaG family iron-sulfur metabolism protein [Alphaproteobacteria bacterium]